MEYHVRLLGLFKGLKKDSWSFTSTIITVPLFNFEQRFMSSALKKSSQI